MSVWSSMKAGVARTFARAAMAVDMSALSDFWYRGEDLPVSTWAGIDVTDAMARRNTVANTCIRIYGNYTGMMPAKVHETTAEGDKRRAEDHPVDRLIHAVPNEYQTPFEFFREVGVALAGRGNSYVELIRDGRSQVAQLWPMGGDHVYADWLERRTGRRRIYDVSSGLDGRARVLTDGDVWHAHGQSLDEGLTGASPIRLNAQGIGMSLAAQRYASEFFTGGSKYAGFITPEGTQLGDTQAEQLKKSLKEGAAQSHTFKVYPFPLKFHHTSIGPKDAQLMETLNWSVADTARVWSVPLWLLQHEAKDSSWGSGLEQMGIGFDVYTMMPILRSIEQGLTRSLLSAEMRIFVEFVVDALLRADIKTKYEVILSALNAANPLITRDEARAKLNWPKKSSDDGDRFLIQENNLGSGSGMNKTGGIIIPPGANGQSGDVHAA